MPRGKAAKKKRAAELAAQQRKEAQAAEAAARAAAEAEHASAGDAAPEADGDVTPAPEDAAAATEGGAKSSEAVATGEGGATEAEKAKVVGWGAAKKGAEAPPAPSADGGAAASSAAAPPLPKPAASGGASGGAGGAAPKTGMSAAGLDGLEMDEETQSLVLHSEITMRLVEGITVNCSTHDRTIHPNAKDIAVTNCTMSLFGFDLLQDTDIKLSWGQRYGLIGPNGCGKSTLMHMLGRRMIPMPKSIDSFHVTSEVEASDKSALTSVMEVDVERRALEAEADEVGELLDDPEFGDAYAERLNAIYERLEELEADTAEMRAAAILHGLGFDRDMQNKATKDFSGGWRMRIALARALFLQPSLLLLDEPTNHLDMEAVVWLETYLSRWKNILLIVSHSQDFMNGVCTNIIHMHQKRLDYYGGNYDQFCVTRKEKEDHQQKRYQWEQEQMASMKQYIAKFGHGTKKMARQAQSKEKTLAKMVRGGLTEKVSEDRTIQMRFPECGKIAPPVLMLQEVTFGYSADKILFRNVDFGIDLDSRIALVGANGMGKTTLLKLISGELIPLSGNVRPNAHLRIGRYTQHFVDALDMDMNPLEYIMSLYPDKPKEDFRRYLGRFGVAGSSQTQKMAFLSDGIKSRVVFALVAYTKPHILSLDEPTNHLDIESIDALAAGINEFEGGLILVSHDMRLISQVAKEIWVCEDQTITRFNGTIEDYKRELQVKLERLARKEEREAGKR